VDLQIDAARLDPELETVVYRLVQEALTNIAKHADAAMVELQVRSAGDRLAVLIADDGVGFDPTASVGGFVLAGMRERVALAGGELRIESKSGTGTKVLASVPVGAEGDGSGLDQAPGERALD